MIEWTSWLRAELAERARREAPLEACGLITEAVPTEEGVRGRLHLWEAENGSETPETAFLIAPASQLAIVEEFTKRGERLVATYHSHPRQGAAPSPSDEELARLWPGLTWLIVGLNGVGQDTPYPEEWGEVDYFAGILCPE